jgi:lipoprotein NlpD
MSKRSRMPHVAVVLGVAGLVAACQPAAPPTTVPNESASAADMPSASPPTPAPAAKRDPQNIVVQPGQSVSRIAATYDVPQQAIISANHLDPPYKIKIGQRLLVPSPNKAGLATATIIEPTEATSPGPVGEHGATATTSPAALPVTPVESAATHSDSAGGASAAIVTAPTSLPLAAAPPPGITCPSGAIGSWSDRDVTKIPVYVCLSQRPS